MFAVKIAKLVYKSRILSSLMTGDVELIEVTHLSTPINASAMTIGNAIFFTPGALDRCGVLEHELVHVEQWRRLGSVGFPLVYGAQFAWEWLKLAVRGQFRESVWVAYHNIPLEKEAYATYPKR